MQFQNIKPFFILTGGLGTNGPCTKSRSSSQAVLNSSDRDSTLRYTAGHFNGKLVIILL